MREQTHNEEMDQVSPQSLEVLVGEWLRQRDLKLVAGPILHRRPDRSPVDQRSGVVGLLPGQRYCLCL